MLATTIKEIRRGMEEYVAIALLSRATQSSEAMGKFYMNGRIDGFMRKETLAIET